MIVLLELIDKYYLYFVSLLDDGIAYGDGSIIQNSNFTMIVLLKSKITISKVTIIVLLVSQNFSVCIFGYILKTF